MTQKFEGYFYSIRPKKGVFSILFPKRWGMAEPIFAFCNFKMKMCLKCHAHCVIHHYLCVSVWMQDDRCRSCSQRYTTVEKWQKVTVGTAEQEETGWTDERPTHKIGWKTGADMGGGAEREKWRAREGENKRCQFADEMLGSQKAI